MNKLLIKDCIELCREYAGKVNYLARWEFDPEGSAELSDQFFAKLNRRFLDSRYSMSTREYDRLVSLFLSLTKDRDREENEVVEYFL